MSSTRFTIKRNRAEGFYAQNPLLDVLEIGLETDSVTPYGFKFGDSVTRWNDLPYVQIHLIHSNGNLAKGKHLLYDEINATSDGQDTFSFPNVNGMYICALFVEGLKIPRSRFSHITTDITLTEESDIEAIETGFEIGVFYRAFTPPVPTP